MFGGGFIISEGKHEKIVYFEGCEILLWWNSPQYIWEVDENFTTVELHSRIS